jgi:hypothetical protein
MLKMEAPTHGILLHESDMRSLESEEEQDVV